MVKRLSLLLTIAAALSLVVSATASASKMTQPAGVLVPVGSAITLTGNDVTFTSNLIGATTCEKLNLKMTLTKNDGVTVEGSGPSEIPAQAGCKNGARAVIITTFMITNFVTTGGGLNGTMSFIATEDIGETHCTYTGTKVPFTYAAGGDTIVFNNAAGIAGVPAACGTAKLDATFTLEIGAVAVILD